MPKCCNCPTCGAPLGIDIRTSWGEGLYLATDEVRFRPKLLQGRPKLRDVA